ncbi:uncharacterized protein DS421_11g330510 [Arachis hypogaea]|nr:uncharacterized protein DS421_11g330510 [Arachis hypogaea]
MRQWNSFFSAQKKTATDTSSLDHFRSNHSNLKATCNAQNTTCNKKSKQRQSLNRFGGISGSHLK